MRGVASHPAMGGSVRAIERGIDRRIECCERELAALARAHGALRLRLGQVLEVLHEKQHCFTLGFSSVAAYALERCEQSGRWVEETRCLARRLERLPSMRRALAQGELPWSAVELVARVAKAETELHWLSAAATHTVRQLRPLVRAAGAKPEAQKLDAVTPTADPDLAEDEEVCTLSVTVNREDAWLFEATQKLLEQLGTKGTAAQLEALLAEGQESLLAALPRGSIDPDALELSDAAQQRWREQLQRWQTAAEERCEAMIHAARKEAPHREDRSSPVVTAAAAGCSTLGGATASDLDLQLRGLSQLLARQELDLSRALLSFHRADGWRRLGYASESQYARERLGVSHSALLARRALALRLEALPSVAAALGSAQIGVEAALQIARIATPHTERAWLERAGRRTIKHLREEVNAALTAVRLSGELDCPPPHDAEIEAYTELERAVASGRAGEGCAGEGRAGEGRAESVSESAARLSFLAPDASVERRAWHTMLASLHAWLEGGVLGTLQMSAASRASRSAGRVELRLRVTRHVFHWWRGLQAQARRWLPQGMSWLKFLCLSIWRAWRHVLGVDVAYGAIYERDACRCTSPVCSRRDVTPHHLRFRSQGGGEEPDNLASVCTWCHLFGIHGGRIRARGTAGNIRWEIGPVAQPCVVVQGRERQVS
ncbi:MAG TPA: hypothetical protein VG963_17610 [Polyangiaceae bacterium]|nr:hypothetical protein [Polyangiaceae bacterium]